MKKLYLQDCVVTLDVMDEIKHFGHQIQGGDFAIPTIHLMLKKIQMMQLYMQIEWTYVKKQKKFHGVSSRNVV